MHSSSEISKNPIYYPLQKPMNIRSYELQEPVTSEAKFSTSSAINNNNYPHLVSLLGASRMDSSAMYAKVMGHDITRLHEEPTPLNLSEMPNASSAVCSKILSSPYYASLRNPDGSSYESLTYDHQSSSSFAIPMTSANLDGYQALNSLYGSLQNPGSSLHLELGNDPAIKSEYSNPVLVRGSYAASESTPNTSLSFTKLLPS